MIMIVEKTLIIYLEEGEKDEFLEAIHNTHISILSDTAFRIDFSNSRDGVLSRACDCVMKFNKCGLSKNGHIQYKFPNMKERIKALNKIIRKVLWVK